MSSTVITQCPALAPVCPETIITASNQHFLKPSTCSRTVGTKVILECLLNSVFTLIGDNQLKCLESGVWDKTIPTCNKSTTGTSSVTSESGVIISNSKNNETPMEPLMIIVIVVGVILFFLIFVMVCVTIYWWRSQSDYHGKKSMSNVRSLSIEEAESVFSGKRRDAYSFREMSDVMESVSTVEAPRTQEYFARDNPLYLSTHHPEYYGDRTYYGAQYPGQPRPPPTNGNYCRSPSDSGTGVISSKALPRYTPKYRTWREWFYS